MTADFTVRKFESSDADEVIALWNKALPSSQPWNEPKDVICRKLNMNDGLFFGQVNALAAMAFYERTEQSPLSKWQTHLFKFQTTK